MIVYDQPDFINHSYDLWMAHPIHARQNTIVPLVRMLFKCMEDHDGFMFVPRLPQKNNDGFLAIHSHFPRA